MVNGFTLPKLERSMVKAAPNCIRTISVALFYGTWCSVTTASQLMLSCLSRLAMNGKGEQFIIRCFWLMQLINWADIIKIYYMEYINGKHHYQL